MSKRLALRASFICTVGLSALFFTACDDGNTSPADGGTVVDDGGSSPVESDAGNNNTEGRPLGGTCVVANDQCADGLVCYPNPLNPASGTCRTVCGALNAAGDDIDFTNPDPCSGGDVCQAVLNLNAAEGDSPLAGIVCLPQATQRDGACVPTVNDASCAASIGANVECTRAGDNFACTLSCSEDSECTGAESCLATGSLTPEPTDNAAGFIDCAADATVCGVDYPCTSVSFNDGSTGDICAAQDRTCATAISPVTLADLDAITETQTIPEDLTCLTEGSRKCETFFETPEHGFNQCVALTEQGAGVCFAICGLINDDRTEYDLFEGCPATFECNVAQGLGFSLGFNKKDAADADVTCDSANCTDGEPCPSECGDDAQAYCLKGAAADTCFYPVFTCEPEATVVPETDAGVDVDAGATDAGTPATDAGTPATDAGTPATDAGTPATDAGAPAATLCEQYCANMTANCADTFATAEACATACAAYPTDGVDGATEGDSVQCRIYHSGDPAAADGATHCPHAGIDGGNTCVVPAPAP